MIATSVYQASRAFTNNIAAVQGVAKSDKPEYVIAFAVKAQLNDQSPMPEDSLHHGLQNIEYIDSKKGELCNTESIDLQDSTVTV